MPPEEKYNIDYLRLACAHIYNAWWDKKLQPGRGSVEWPGPEQEEMATQVIEEWMDITGLSLSDFPWKPGLIVAAWIAYRKKPTEEKSDWLYVDGQLSVPPGQGVVYFWQELDTGNIKIGFTSRTLPEREREMKGYNSSPVRFRGYIPGTKQHERTLQITFAGHRIYRNREWFRPCKELLDYIKTHAKSV